MVRGAHPTRLEQIERKLRKKLKILNKSPRKKEKEKNTAEDASDECSMGMGSKF